MNIMNIINKLNLGIKINKEEDNLLDIDLSPTPEQQRASQQLLDKEMSEGRFSVEHIMKNIFNK